MTYKNLINQLKTILNNVEKVHKVYPYPEANLKGYPAVVFFPDMTENDWEDVKQDRVTYRFKLFVIVAKVGKATEEDLFTDYLPDTTDNVITAIRNNWSLTGTNRTWMKFDTGLWTLQKPDDGPVTATAEIDLSIRTLI